MSYGIKLLIKGDYACFTRPEMKVERVSYDVMTPSAARGIIEAIHWKPAILWVIDRIHVLAPVRFENIRRNEIASKIPASNVKTAMKAGSVAGLHLNVDEDRQQRAMMALRNVVYGVEAHLEMTPKAGPEDNPAKHIEMARRRAEKGQHFHQPCLGVREFPADVTLVEGFPETALPAADRNRDLGWMLYDIAYDRGRDALFFHARMEDGVIDVEKARQAGLAR
ncbi:type I-C CRISPR-associated protein Cas5c [Salipiger sp. P9]|uniref:type I-C CRISPR-associated protein Cas5c n=1 Tax=Salipiger pentaromativorans TaxID=2943193 RepID=UPI00215888D2|nr:type I-C CRISPR-associated protein Cas5c [Salipiger pentaromativorans]MCR8547609.1 type I-C CRISPR-associated protein Cas5c [Salipiger pentaromativorans]